MKKLFITLFLLAGLGIGALGWAYYNEVGPVKVLFDENFPDNQKLSNNYIFIKANRSLDDLELSSNCNIKSKLLGYNSGLNVFSFSLKDNKCRDFQIFLEDSQGRLEKTFTRIKLVTKGDILKFYTDFSDEDLALQISSFQNKLKKFQEEDTKNKFRNLFLSQQIEKTKYYIELLNYIKNGRQNKYIIPTPGYDMPTQPVRFPNAGRGYRASYTDGIHHGWDFYAPLRSNVISLDDGVVIRVVRDFQFSDLEKVDYGNNLTVDDKSINLDILRGNQVWIKTLKGDVALYSHLSEVYDDIQEGMFIPKNYPVGKIGITGVPDANYKNYHLHLPIQKNPYNKEKYGKYSYLDIMNWDWLFKGQTLNYIAKHQYDIFTK